MNEITFKINNGGTMRLLQYDHDGEVEFTTEFPTVYGTDYDADLKIPAADFVMLMNSYEHFKGTGEWLPWEVKS